MKTLRDATDTLRELALVYGALLTLSALLFMALEGRSLAESLYWAGATATSTGYGDISPSTAGGRVLAFVLMHVSIFGVAPLIVVRLVDRLNTNRDAFTHEEQERILAAIARMEKALNCATEREEAEAPRRPD